MVDHGETTTAVAQALTIALQTGVLSGKAQPDAAGGRVATR